MERLFLVEFWSNGVSMARGNTPDLHQLASGIDLWVTHPELRVSRLSSVFPWVTPNDCATAFEEGRAADWKWETLILFWERLPEVRTLINRAALEPALRRPFPYTSLNTICFSRCTGYPFTSDTACMTPIGGGQYVVSVQDCRKFLGRVDVELAVKITVEHLPPGCGAARAGTADDEPSSKTRMQVSQ